MIKHKAFIASVLHIIFQGVWSACPAPGTSETGAPCNFQSLATLATKSFQYDKTGTAVTQTFFTDYASTDFAVTPEAFIYKKTFGTGESQMFTCEKGNTIRVGCADSGAEATTQDSLTNNNYCGVVDSHLDTNQLCTVQAMFNPNTALQCGAGKGKSGSFTALFTTAFTYPTDGQWECFCKYKTSQCTFVTYETDGTPPSAITLVNPTRDNLGGLTTQTTAPFRATVVVNYVTTPPDVGVTARKKAMTYDITVCGNELVTKTTTVETFRLYQANIPTNTQSIDGSFYGSLFNLDASGSQTHPSCTFNSWTLTQLADGATAFTDAAISFGTTADAQGRFPINVNTGTVFIEKKFWLKAQTKGIVFATSEFRITVGPSAPFETWPTGLTKNQRVDINDNNAQALTRFTLPTIQPPNSACTINTYQLVGAPADLSIAQVSGTWYVTPTNKATHKKYSFNIRAFNSVSQCAEFITDTYTLDVGCASITFAANANFVASLSIAPGSTVINRYQYAQPTQTPATSYCSYTNTITNSQVNGAANANAVTWSTEQTQPYANVDVYSTSNGGDVITFQITSTNPGGVTYLSLQISITVSCLGINPTIASTFAATQTNEILIGTATTGRYTFPGWQLDTPQCPIASNALVEVTRAGVLDATAAVLQPGCTQPSCTVVNLQSTATVVTITFKFATTFGSGQQSVVKTSPLITMNIGCNSAIITVNNGFATTQNKVIELNSATTGVYTYPMPTVDHAPCNIQTNALVDVLVDTTPTPSAAVFQTGCTQPCQVVNIDSTATVKVIKFKIASTLPGRTFTSAEVSISINCAASAITRLNNVVDYTLGPLSVSNTAAQYTALHGVLLTSNAACPITGYSLLAADGTAWSNTAQISVTSVTVNGKVEPTITVTPSTAFSTTVRVVAANQGGATNYVNYAITAACDGTIAVTRTGADTFTFGPYQMSNTPAAKTDVHGKLVSANNACPINAFTLKDSSGNAWTNNALISVSAVDVSGLKEPTLTVKVDTVFTQTIQVHATNTGGSTNFVTVTISTACDNSVSITLPGGATLSKSLSITSTATTDTGLYGKLTTSIAACPVNAYAIKANDGTAWSNTARIALSTQTISGVLEPVLTINHNTPFTEVVKIEATNTGGATGTLTYTITAACDSAVTITKTGGDTFSTVLTVSQTASQLNTLYGKMVSSQSACPINAYALKASDGSDWTNTARISVAGVTVSGLLEPQITVNPTVSFVEVVRVVATNTGGATTYVTFTITAQSGCEAVGVTLTGANSFTLNTLSVSSTAVTKTDIHGKFDTARADCPLATYSLLDNSGNAWTNSGRISVSTVEVSGIKQPTLTILPNAVFTETVRVVAANTGGQTAYVTVTVSAACDGTVSVNKAAGDTLTIGPLSLSATAATDTTVQGKLVTAEAACPINAYALKNTDGSDWTNNALISVATATVSGVLTPTLTIKRDTIFSQQVRLQATNTGSATNFITITISSACDNTITVDRSGAATFTLGPIQISSTAVQNTDLHGKLVSANSLCPINSYALKAGDGTSWTNTARISLTEVTVSGLKQPTITVLPDSVFTETVRIEATNTGGSSNYVSYTISTGCDGSVTVTQTAGATFTINLSILSTTVDKTDIYGKLATSNAACPINSYAILKNDGTAWTNNARITLTEVTVSGIKQPKLTIKPDAVFTEVVRIQATNTGGSSAYVTVTINAACDSTITVDQKDLASYSISLDTGTGPTAESTLLHGKLDSSNAVCGITAYSIQNSDGTEYNNPSQLTINAVTVSGKLQPTLVFDIVTQYQIVVRIVATNAGGSTNYVTLTLTTSNNCGATSVLTPNGQTFSISVPLSTTAVENISMHGNLVTSKQQCKMTLYKLQNPDGSDYTKPNRITVTAVTVNGKVQPTLTILPDVVFTEPIRILGTNDGGNTNFISVTVTSTCTGVLVNQANGADFSKTFQTDTVAQTDTTIHGKLVTAVPNCPITGYSLQNSVGAPWTNTARISVASVDVSGVKQPTLTVLADVEFQEVVRVVATNSGGATNYVTFTITASANCGTATITTPSGTTFTVGPISLSSTSVEKTDIHGKLVPSRSTCPITSYALQAADGTAWTNTARISVAGVTVSGLLQPTLTIKPDAIFSEQVRVVATNVAGVTGFVTVTISAACDNTISITQSGGATFTIGPLSISSTDTTSTAAHGKLTTSNALCPINAYALKAGDGTDWTNTARINVAAVTVSGLLQPTLTIKPDAVFSETVRVVATNTGGATNYVTYTISAACDGTIAVNIVGGTSTFTLGPLSLSSNNVDKTDIHGKFTSANGVCPINSFSLLAGDGSAWSNTNRISVTAVDVSGVKQPTLTIKPDAIFTETVRVVATNTGGATNYVTVTISTACDGTISITKTGGNSFSIGPLSISSTQTTSTTLHGKLDSSNSLCPINAYALLANDGSAWTNTGRININSVTVSGKLEPSIIVLPDAVFSETVRVQATNTGGSTAYVTLSVSAACDGSISITKTGADTFTWGPLSISSTTQDSTAIHGKLDSANQVCPINAYTLKANDGTNWINTNRISLSTVTVSGKLQPTITVKPDAVFSEIVRVVATNTGGSTGFVTFTISTACDGTILVNQVSGATVSIGPLSISSSTTARTEVQGKLVSANAACPINAYVLKGGTGGAWSNTDRISISTATVSGNLEPILTVKPDAIFTETIRVEATNTGGSTNYVTVTVSAACDGTITVIQTGGTSFTLSVEPSATATTDQTIHGKLDSSNQVCPINAYSLKSSDGTAWSNTARIDLQTVTVSGKLQPNIIVNHPVEFTETIRVYATNTGGATNYVTFVISSSNNCGASAINVAGASTFTVGPLSISSTILSNTAIHGALVTSKTLCPITSFTILNNDGTTWTNNARIDVETVDVSGIKQPTLKIKPDAIFSETVRVQATNNAGKTGYVTVTISAACDNTISISKTGADTFTLTTLSISSTAATKTDIHGKLVTSNSVCPINAYALKAGDGSAWSNTNRISIAGVTVSGVLEPTLTIMPDAVFTETVRVEATNTGGATSYVTVTIQAACDGTITISQSAGATFTVTKSISNTAATDTSIYGKLVTANTVCPISSWSLRSADGSAWLNTDRISVTATTVSGVVQPLITILPNAVFTETVRVVATNTGGSQNYVTVTINAVCDNTIAVTQTSGATVTIAALSLSTTSVDKTDVHGKLDSAHPACPINAYALQAGDGTTWSNTNRIAISSVTVSGKLQPTLTIKPDAIFSETVRVQGANSGGSTNYVTVTISAACDGTISITQTGGATFTIAALSISSTAVTKTDIHGKLDTANSLCPINAYALKTNDGSTWSNTDRISVAGVDVTGKLQPTLTIKPDAVFTEIVRVEATNTGGAKGYVTVTISAACDGTITINQAAGATFTITKSISDTAATDTSIYDKLVTANTVCPINAWALKKADGTDWTNTARISITPTTVSGVVQPQITILANAVFSETVRVVATNTGGSTNYVTVTINAACDNSVGIVKTAGDTFSIGPLQISQTSADYTTVHGKLDSAHPACPINGFTLKANDGTAWSNTQRISVTMVDVSGKKQPTITVKPDQIFSETVRVEATNTGGSTGYITLSVSTACDGSVAVIQTAGATFNIGPIRVAATAVDKQDIHGKLDSANVNCPINAYVIKANDGSAWTNTNRISLKTETISGKLQPTLTVLPDAEFTETIRVVATNTGGSSNYVTVTITASTICDNVVTINIVAGNTFTIGPLSISSTAATFTTVHGSMVSSDSKCPITSYSLLKNDGTAWTNTDRVSVQTVDVSGAKQPTLTVKPDSVFSEVIRVQATNSGGSTGYVTVTISAACDNTITITKTAGDTLTIAPISISTTAIDKTDAHGKLDSSNAACPINAFVLKKSDGSDWTNTQRISVNMVDVSGKKQPTLSIKPDAVFTEVVRVVATNTGGSTSYITVTISAACDGTITVNRAGSDQFSRTLPLSQTSTQDDTIYNKLVSANTVCPINSFVLKKSDGTDWTNTARVSINAIDVSGTLQPQITINPNSEWTETVRVLATNTGGATNYVTFVITSSDQCDLTTVDRSGSDTFTISTLSISDTPVTKQEIHGKLVTSKAVCPITGYSLLKSDGTAWTNTDRISVETVDVSGVKQPNLIIKPNAVFSETIRVVATNLGNKNNYVTVNIAAACDNTITITKTAGDTLTIAPISISTNAVDKTDAHGKLDSSNAACPINAFALKAGDGSAWSNTNRISLNAVTVSGKLQPTLSIKPDAVFSETVRVEATNTGGSTGFIIVTVSAACDGTISINQAAGATFTISKSISDTAGTDTTIYDKLISASPICPINAWSLKKADGSDWTNTARISVTATTISGVVQPLITILPNSVFTEVIRVQASHTGGTTNYVTLTINAACDNTIAVNQAAGSTFSIGPISISSVSSSKTDIHGKLVSAHPACPINVYALKNTDGSAWTNTDRISVSGVDVSGLLQPTLSIKPDAVFSQAIQVVATNTGGSTNYVTVTISAACDNTITIAQTGGATFTISALSISSTAATKTDIHGKLVTSNSVCPINAYALKAGDGSAWSNTNRISIAGVTVSGVLEPTLTIMPDAVFTETVRVEATNTGGATGYVSVTISAACDGTITINQASGASLTIGPISQGATAVTNTAVQGKLVTSNTVCPINAYTLKAGDGTAWTNTQRVSLTTADVSGTLTPTLSILPNDKFQETIRLVATNTGGSTNYITLTITTADLTCDSAIAVNLDGANTATIGPLQISATNIIENTLLYGRFVTANYQCPIQSFTLQKTDGTAWTNTALIKVDGVVVSGKLQPKITIAPTIPFSQDLKLIASNGGSTNQVTVSISAACDSTISVNRVNGDTLVIPSFVISSTATDDASFLTTMVTSNNQCPISSYSLQKQDGTTWTNTARISIVQVSGNFRLRILHDTIFTEVVRVVFTNSGGAQNYVFVQITVACSSGQKVITTQGSSFSLGPLLVQSTPTVDTTIHGKLATELALCPITRYELKKTDGTAWSDNKISVQGVLVSGILQPTITINTSSAFSIQVRVVGINSGNEQNYVTFTIATCGPDQSVVRVPNAGTQFFLGPIQVGSPAFDNQVIHGKLATSLAACPIDYYSLQTSSGQVRINDARITINTVTVNGFKQPNIFINPIVPFAETLRVVAHLNGGSTNYVTYQIETCNSDNTVVSEVSKYYNFQPVSLYQDPEYYPWSPYYRQEEDSNIFKFKKFTSSQPNCPIQTMYLTSGNSTKPPVDTQIVFKNALECDNSSSSCSINDNNMERLNFYIFMQANGGAFKYSLRQHNITNLFHYNKVNPNFGPYFLVNPQGILQVGVLVDKSGYVLGETEYIYTSPEVRDDEGDEIIMQLNGLQSLYGASAYRSGNKYQVKIDKTQISLTNMGNHYLQVTIGDAEHPVSQSFRILVMVTYSMQAPDYVDQLNIAIEDTFTPEEKTQMEARKSNFWLKEFTPMGLLTIGFDPSKVSLEQIDINQLNEAVSIRVESPTATERDDIDQSSFNFNFELTEFEKQEGVMAFQLEFTNPLIISTGKEEDSIILSFNSSKLTFLDEQTSRRLSVSSNVESAPVELRIKMIRQMPNNSQSHSFDITTKVLAVLAEKGLFIFFVYCAWYKRGGEYLKRIMTTLMALQFVLHLGLLNLVIPANVHVLLQNIRNLTMMNLLDFVAKLNKVFLSVDEQAQSKIVNQYLPLSMQAIGITTMNSIHNLGNLGQMLIFYGLDYLFFSFIAVVILHYRPNERLAKMMIDNLRFIKWQPLIAMCFFGFMPVTISIMLNYRNPLFSTFGEVISFLGTIGLTLLVYVWLPYLIIKIAVQSPESLSTPSFKHKYAFLYEDLKLETLEQKLYQIIFLLRRLVLIWIAFDLHEVGSIQIILVVMLNLFWLIYKVSCDPMRTNQDKTMDIIVEIFTMIMCYHLLIFSNWVTDIQVRYEVGWSYTTFLIMMLLSFAHVYISKLLWLARLKLYRKYLLWQKERRKNFVQVQTVVVYRDAPDNSETQDYSLPQEYSSKSFEKQVLKQQYKQRSKLIQSRRTGLKFKPKAEVQNLTIIKEENTEADEQEIEDFMKVLNSHRAKLKQKRSQEKAIALQIKKHLEMSEVSVGPTLAQKILIQDGKERMTDDEDDESPIKKLM